MTIFDLANYLDNLQNSISRSTPSSKSTSKSKYLCDGIPGYFVPTISRVHYNGNKTIVWFTDNSKCVVECSAADNYDRKTAIAYAIVKRMMGKVGAKDNNGKWDPHLVDGNGFGQILQKIVDAGFDQIKANQELANQKRAAKAKHEAQQQAEKNAAFERRARKLAEELRLKKRAEEILANESSKKILNESPSIASSNKPYVRPNKPFREFSVAEKREYWRNQNSRRKFHR